MHLLTHKINHLTKERAGDVLFSFFIILILLLIIFLRVGLVECVPTGTGKNHVCFYPHDHEYFVRVFDPRYCHPSRWTRTPVPVFRPALPTYKSATSRWTQTPAPVFCCGEFHGSHTSLFRSRPSRRTQAPLPSYLLCCVLDYFREMTAVSPPLSLQTAIVSLPFSV